MEISADSDSDRRTIHSPVTARLAAEFHLKLAFSERIVAADWSPKRPDRTNPKLSYEFDCSEDAIENLRRKVHHKDAEAKIKANEVWKSAWPS